MVYLRKYGDFLMRLWCSNIFRRSVLVVINVILESENGHLVD